MNTNAGPYSFTLPDQADVSLRPPKEYPFSPDALAKIGPFFFYAQLSQGTIEEAKEHVLRATRREAKFEDLEFNGIPGFMQVDTTGAGPRRIDYVFRAPGAELVSIVATSRVLANEMQQAMIHEVVRTISVDERPP